MTLNMSAKKSIRNQIAPILLGGFVISLTQAVVLPFAEGIFNFWDLLVWVLFKWFLLIFQSWLFLRNLEGRRILSLLCFGLSCWIGQFLSGSVFRQAVLFRINSQEEEWIHSLENTRNFSDPLLRSHPGLPWNGGWRMGGHAPASTILLWRTDFSKEQCSLNGDNLPNLVYSKSHRVAIYTKYWHVFGFN